GVADARVQRGAKIVSGIGDAVLEDRRFLLDALYAREQVGALDDAAEPAEEGFGFLRGNRLVGTEGVVRREGRADGAKDLCASAVRSEVLRRDPDGHQDFRGADPVVRRSSDAAARQSSSQALCFSPWCDDVNPGPARHACHLILRTSGPLNLCINAYLALAHLDVPAIACR